MGWIYFIFPLLYLTPNAVTIRQLFIFMLLAYSIAKNISHTFSTKEKIKYRCKVKVRKPFDILGGWGLKSRIMSMEIGRPQPSVTPYIYQ